MSRLWNLGAVLVLACSSTSTPGEAGGEPRLRLRLTTKDPHLVGVARVELQLRRDNVFFSEQVSGSGGQGLALPAELVVKVPIGAGALQIDATVRGLSGEVVGDGTAQAVAPASGTAEASLELYSLRTDRPSRRPTVADGGVEEDAALPDAAPDKPPVPIDAGGEAGPSDAAPLPPDAGCTSKSYRLVASAVVGVDYGSIPRDQVDSRVAVSSGFGHMHVHDFVGWMRFDLDDIPANAELVSLKILLQLDQSSSPPPPLGILYSPTDKWNPAIITSDTAEMITRGARVASDLGFPLPGRAPYAVDVAKYRPFWSGDLRDKAVTLGMISTTTPDIPETWAYFESLTGRYPPALDLTTCE
jgi:hypothetical protein